MEDVELYRGHRIEVALKHRDGLEMATAIDHQATPVKTRGVLHGDRRQYVAGTLWLHQL